MVFLFGLSVACNVIFYLLFANLITEAFVTFPSLLIPPVIIIFASMLSYVLNENGKPRMLPALLLPLVFLFANSIEGAVVLAIPALYALISMAKRLFYFDKEKLRRRTIVCGKIVFVPLVGLLFGGYDRLLYTSYFAYLFVFAVCAISLLRISRSGENNISDKKFIGLNIGIVTLFLVGAGILVSPPVLNALSVFVGFFFSSIFVPTILFIISIFISIISLVPLPEAGIFEPDAGDGFAGQPTGMFQANLEQPDATVFTIVVITILLIIALIVLRKVWANVKIRHKFFNTGFESQSYSQIEPFMSIKESRVRDSRFFTPRDPRLAVRHYYRRFLRLCIKKGNLLQVGETSHDVTQKNVKHFPIANMSALRVLYIKARYSNHEITALDSKETAKILKSF